MWIPITFYVAVIALALFRPYLGLLGLIASLLIRFQDRFEAIAAIPTFQIIALALIIGMILHSDQINKPALKMDRLIAGFAGYVFVGIVLMNRSAAIEQMTGLLSSILIYFLVTRLVTSRRQLVGLLVFLSAVTVGLGAESLASYYVEFASPFSNPTTGRLQGLGYYANANEFGKLMCTAIPFTAILMFRGNFIWRLVALAAIILMVIVVAETLSRTCFVALILILGAAIMLRSPGQMIKKVVIASVCGILLLYSLSYLPGPLQERAQSITQYSTDKSFQGRVRAWDQGFKMVSWYPIFGVGKGQWAEYHGRSPHNSFVQVLAETGIPGFILFMSIVWTAFRNVTESLAAVRDSKLLDLRIIGLAIGSSYVGYLFYILLGNQGYSPWTYFYFGICGVISHLVFVERGARDQNRVQNKDADTAAYDEARR